jgi:aspartate kinase
LALVTYAEICNMANQGAKVIHPRAVEIAMQANIPIRVRSTFSEEEGTLVTHPEVVKQRLEFKDRHITGLTYVSNVTQIQILAEQGQYDLQLNIFKAMAQHHISVDFINVNPSGIVYTVFDKEADKALQLLKKMGYSPKHLSQCTKISVIGGGMNGVPGIMAKIVEALTEENIQILQSADSNTTIWILVNNEHMTKGIQTLHQKFKLHE